MEGAPAPEGLMGLGGTGVPAEGCARVSNQFLGLVAEQVVCLFCCTVAHSICVWCFVCEF